MNGKQFLAQQYAAAYLDDDHESARTEAYLVGFEKALDMACGLVLSLESPKTQGLSVLIKAIGRAEVDKSGRRIVDVEDERLPS